MLATQLDLKYCNCLLCCALLLFLGYAGSSLLCRLSQLPWEGYFLAAACRLLVVVASAALLQAWVPGTCASVAAARWHVGLSGPQGSNPCPLHWKGWFSTTGTQGKPLTVYWIIFLLDFSSGILKSELMSSLTVILYPLLGLCTLNSWLKSVEPWCKAKSKDCGLKSFHPGHLPFCCTSCRASAAYLVALGVGDRDTRTLA